MRCESRHPETGHQCERLANTCWGRDHQAKDAEGELVCWPDPPPANAMERYFREFAVARRKVLQERGLEDGEIIEAVKLALGEDILPPMIHVLNIKADSLPDG